MGQTKYLRVYCDDYEIMTLATSRPENIREWLQKYDYYYDREVIVGLDVEWQPKTREQIPETLQLCIGTDCIVIQVRQLDNFGQLEYSDLQEFVANSSFIFSGVGIKGDITRLERYYNLQFHDRVFELKGAAKRRGCKYGNRYSLESLAQSIGQLDFVKDRAMAMSDWGKHNLSYEQIGYAARDAFVSCHVAEKLEPQFDCYGNVF